ncbi:MAG: hypothetical protein ABIH24_10575 [Verrucomicrobiota bacterium]
MTDGGREPCFAPSAAPGAMDWHAGSYAGQAPDDGRRDNGFKPPNYFITKVLCDVKINIDIIISIDMIALIDSE